MAAPIRPEEEVYRAVLRAADLLHQGLGDALRPVELTPTQYDVLAILRAAGPAGLPSGEVGVRLITREPDVTRLLDRLDRRGLVRRERDAEDRRVVRVRLSPEGVRQVNSLDRLVADLRHRLLGHLGAARLQELLTLLDEIGRPPL